MAEHPTNELVAIHWAKTLGGLPSQQIGTTLPADNSTWAASGFVQVGLAAGRPGMYLPVNEPVIQWTCWAHTPDSGKPPWRRANRLAEILKAATYEPSNYKVVSTPAAYEDARVMEAHPLTEPRRVTGDDARFAGFTLDMQLYWVVSP